MPVCSKTPPPTYTLVANITITDDLGTYKGTATGSIGGRVFTADVTWTLDSVKDSVATYVPSGTVSVSDSIEPCPFTPTSATIKPTDGTLLIDFRKTPTPYYGGGGGDWAITLSCPGGSVAGYEEGFWFGNAAATSLQGYLSPDLNEIKGSGMSGQFNTSWVFTRQAPQSP